MFIGSICYNTNNISDIMKRNERGYVMTREEALDWFGEEVSSDSLKKHCYAVEASMRIYAEKLNEDVLRWGLCGLLHDIDFEKYPDVHPFKGVEWLKQKGFDEEFTLAVLGHGDHTNTPRDTQMAKTLYAVDELSSFIVAVALVRPDKFEGLTSKSVKKKMKDKAFARAVSREGIQEGADALGVEITTHIDTVIEGLSKFEMFLNEKGESLL